MAKSFNDINPEERGKISFSITVDTAEREIVETRMPPFVLTPKDSNDPSYTNLVLPYRVICRQRYHQAGVRQRAQFIREVRDHELLQSKALDGVRIHREFCNPVLSKPGRHEMIKLTDKQKMKIEEILSRKY